MRHGPPSPGLGLSPSAEADGDDDDDRAAGGDREVLCGLAAALPLSALIWGTVAAVVVLLVR